LPTITLDPRSIEVIGKELMGPLAPVMSVDLSTCSIVCPSGVQISFSMDEERRLALMEGLDEIEMTLRHIPDIERFEATDFALRPWHNPNYGVR
jgi:3-isopropylmalate/(R)-2-methylmalate dehydratase small subunit